MTDLKPNFDFRSLMRLFDTLPKKRLSHYTSIDTIISMLKGKHEFWLSNINYLNDSEELTHGYNLMKKRLSTYKNMSIASKPLLNMLCESLGLKQNTSTNIYVMSFSEDHDSLNQWRSYTPHGKGITLNLDLSNSKDFLSRNKLHLVKCEYDETLQNKYIDILIRQFELMFMEVFEDHNWPETLEEISSNESALFVYKHALAFGYKIFSILKHPAFNEEREWRLIWQNNNEADSEIDYKVGASMLIPYRKVSIELSDFWKTIKLGPTVHRKLSEDAVAGLLRKYSMTDVAISCSIIPYREW